MKIKVTEKCKTVYNRPVKTGAVVEVDVNTARNLIKKGYATPEDNEAKDLDLEEGSILTAAQAAERVAEQVAAKEAAKEAAEKAAAKKH